MAKERGATLIAFTDPYLSPLAAHADVILTSSVHSPSPFISLTPALAMVEAVVTALLDRLGDLALERMGGRTACTREWSAIRAAPRLWRKSDHRRTRVRFR